MTSPETNSQSKSILENWRHATLTENTTIQDAIRNLDEVALQIVLIVDEKNKLIGTLSDGDIRRGLLKGLQLDSPIESIIFRNPWCAESLQRDLVLQLMTVNKIRQIPIVDEKGRPLGLHIWDHLAQPVQRKNVMVIMAGGRAHVCNRIQKIVPSQCFRLPANPCLNTLSNRQKQKVFMNLLFLSLPGHLIENHFSDGTHLGVKIHYLREETPLGTAGALSLMETRPKRPFVITNGDVMTDIRYSELLDFHIRHAANATMAVRLHGGNTPMA